MEIRVALLTADLASEIRRMTEGMRVGVTPGRMAPGHLYPQAHTWVTFTPDGIDDAHTLVDRWHARPRPTAA